MANSEDHKAVENQARRHSPALIGIIVALALAGIVALVFAGRESEDDVTQTEVPEAPVTEVEGDTGS